MWTQGFIRMEGVCVASKGFPALLNSHAGSKYVHWIFIDMVYHHIAWNGPSVGFPYSPCQVNQGLRRTHGVIT